MTYYSFDWKVDLL